MCLIKLSKIPRIATNDIVVYKLVLMDDEKVNNHSLCTPYMYIPINLGEIARAKGLNIFEIFFSLFSRYIEKGFIHSYQRLNVARIHYRLLNNMMPAKIVRCVIPKGTLYFIGEDEEIASRKLLYVEIID